MTNTIKHITSTDSDIRLGATAAYTYAFRGTNMLLEDYLVSIAALPGLGLHYFDLEILEAKHVPIYSQPHHAAQLKESLATHGVHIAGFTAWACVSGIHSLDQRQFTESLALFEQIASLASSFDAAYIHFGSDMIQQFIAKRDPTYASAPARAFDVPDDTNWVAVIEMYATRLRRLAQVAADHGLKLAVEPRANAIISNADAFMHVAQLADHANLYACYDVMHAAYHREDVSLAIHKLADRLAVLQLCNARDGKMVHRPLDDGDLAIEPILNTLADGGFDGYLMLECYISGNDDQVTVNDWYSKGAAHVRSYLANRSRSRTTWEPS